MLVTVCAGGSGKRQRKLAGELMLGIFVGEIFYIDSTISLQIICLQVNRGWQISSMYTEVHQFEPLLPADARMEPLLARAHDLSRLATALAGMRVPPELRSLLRNMNSYYTNRIEGQHAKLASSPIKTCASSC